MDKKNYVIPFALLGIFSLVLLSGVLYTPSEQEITEGIKYNSDVCVYKNNVLVEPCDHNVVTTAGLNAIKDYIGQGSGGAAFDYIALCNATAGCTAEDAADTTLDNEYAAGGLSRAQGAYTSNGDGNWTYSKTFTATADNLLTNSTGIFNASSTGTMLAEKTFTLVTLQTNDQVTINWTTWAT